MQTHKPIEPNCSLCEDKPLDTDSALTECPKCKAKWPVFSLAGVVIGDYFEIKDEDEETKLKKL
jgi:predicted nucleic acid-binding Zn ribbon protein